MAAAAAAAAEVDVEDGPDEIEVVVQTRLSSPVLVRNRGLNRYAMTAVSVLDVAEWIICNEEKRA